MKKITPLILFLLTTPVWALQLPSIFSDHMVLQRELPVKVWGLADPGASVEVQFADQTVSTEVGPDGTWALTLSPMDGSFESRVLTVWSGEKVSVFKDVLVGEVWLGSGQSNMQWEIRRSVDSDILLLGAGDPYLRFHAVNFQPSREMEFTSNSQWMLDGTPPLQYFSAVAYQFARDLRQTLGVPVGIIRSAVGGTPTIAWTREQKFSEVPELLEKNQEWEAALARYDEDLAAWEAEYAAWREQKGIVEVDYDKHRRQGAPQKPEDAKSPRRPASLAYGMISPIAGTTIRGVIWYQGEADANSGPEGYEDRLRAMIEDWRDWWGDEDLAFGIVQLPNFQKHIEKPTSGPWAVLREGQRQVALKDPHTGLVVTLGLGEADDIHPPNKFPVARRLARWALADVYGLIKLRGGPEIIRAERNESEILLTFDQTGQGLHAADGFRLDGFTASDVDVEPEIWWQTNFYEVAAEIHSPNQVRLIIPKGKDPIRVRYAWQNNPVNANLTNQERLPASPFQIDL